MIKLRDLLENTLTEINKGFFKGKMKIGGHPIEVEVELIGVDNKTREYITQIVGIDKQYKSKLPIGSKLPIPARIFKHGGWVRIKTPSTFGEINVNDSVDTDGKVHCDNCGWEWMPVQSNADETYECHKCGHTTTSTIKVSEVSVNEVVKWKEDINLDVNVGDTLLMGKFKNKRVVVKNIGKDENGMPTINGKKATTFRIPKEETIKESPQSIHKELMVQLNWASTNLEKALNKGDIQTSKRYQKVIKDAVSKMKSYQFGESNVNEDGMPGGAGVGLSLSGGYINGAPSYDKVNSTKKRIKKMNDDRYETVKK